MFNKRVHLLVKRILIYIYTCLCMCVYGFLYVIMNVYIYICVCVCVRVCISFQNVTQKPCPVGDHSLNTHIIFMKICCDQKNLIIQINYVEATAFVYGEEVELECLLFHCVKSRNETCTGDR